MSVRAGNACPEFILVTAFIMDFCKNPTPLRARQPGITWRVRRWFYVLLCAALLTPAVQAKEFFIHDLDTRFTATAMQVEARIEWRLNDTVLDALHNGIPITLSTNIEMAKIRQFLPDPTLASWRFDHQLSYHSLSHRYLLDSPYSKEAQSFEALEAALKAASAIHLDTELVSETLPKSPNGYAMSLKSFLDINALPAPLRVIALVHPHWRLDSTVHRWEARP